jgi:hypothetical protein
MKFSTFFCTCLSVVLLTSCNNDSENEEAVPFLGRYKFVSMTSDVAVDLDNNGVTSTDMMSEIPYYFNDYSTDLIIRNNLFNSADFYLPHCNVYFDYPSEPNGFTEFSNCGFSYEIKYRKNTGAIDIIIPENTEQYREEFGTPLSLERLGEYKLRATIHKQYYDYNSAAWKWLRVTAEYYRTGDNL